jgi:hypothetical protein
MASNQIWLKKRKCNVHVGVSGRSVELRIWIPASVAKNMILQLKRNKRKKKK